MEFVAANTRRSPAAPAALRRRFAAGLVAAAGSSAAWAGAATAAEPVGEVAAYEVEADGITEPLQGRRGDALRGRALVTDRRTGLCLLCHTGPFPEERTPGNLASDLAGAGSRWTVPQLRLRIADARRLDPGGLMPSFHQIHGQQRVAAAWRGKPLLTAQQVEDVVAFLETLR